MTGDVDYILRVSGASTADYEAIHTDILSRLPGVARIHSSLAMRGTAPHDCVRILANKDAALMRICAPQNEETQINTTPTKAVPIDLRTSSSPPTATSVVILPPMPSASTIRGGVRAAAWTQRSISLGTCVQGSGVKPPPKGWMSWRRKLPGPSR